LKSVEDLEEKRFIKQISSGKYALIDDENDLRQVRFNCCTADPNINLHVGQRPAFILMSALGLRKGLDIQLVEKINKL